MNTGLVEALMRMIRRLYDYKSLLELNVAVSLTRENNQLLEAVKDVTDWLDEFASTATREDFEEQKEKLRYVDTGMNSPSS